MRLKSPTEKPIHVALTSGHAIVVGPQARDVPQMFRREALAAGCVPEGVSAEDLDDSPPPAAGKDREAVLVGAIKRMLADDNATDFTASGLPKRNKLSSLAGWNVTAEELTAAWQVIEAEADAEDSAPQE